MAKDSPLDLAQVGARVQPQLVGEEAAEVLVGGERVRLAARPVQRHHQLRAQPLLERVLTDERGQLGRHLRMAAE